MHFHFTVEKSTHLRKEGPPVMEPLARRERKQQTTIMAVTRRMTKMPTARTTIITTIIQSIIFIFLNCKSN